MDAVIAVIAAAGAWLLFAGPLLQAALELRDESVRHGDLQQPSGQRGRVSSWWWLVPPIAIQRHLALRRRFRQQQIASMSEDQIREDLLFSSRATGWLLVASGAFLIAVKETWQAGAELEGPEPVRLAVVVVVAVGAAAAVALHTARAGTVLRHGGPGGGRRGALRAARISARRGDPSRPAEQTEPGAED